MWFLVNVVKGSKYFDADSRIGNRVLISDTTDMIVTSYSTAAGSYRFEMRKGNEAFTLQDVPKDTPNDETLRLFMDLAERLGARSLSPVI